MCLSVPEAPLHIVPLPLIFFGRFSLCMLLKTPIDIHVIAAVVSNNYLQDSLESVER
jgi:hypothetical protein